MYWRFDDVLSTAGEKLSPEELAFYSALADAILDPEKVRELERFERWEEIEPIPIDQPWEMEG